MLIYGFFTIGLLVGFLAYILFGKENGLTLPANIFLGLFGSLSAGILVMAFNVGAEPLFALIGGICFTFIGNVFRPKEDPLAH